MSYESETPIFNLPQWKMSDTISMLDFNQAFSNIDSKAVPNTRTINGHPLTEDIVLDVESNFLAAYPIGALFWTTVSTNPGTLYGGTWAAWGGGRTPVGVNTADSDFNTVEKTGGEKTHTLSVAELPAHSHDLTMRRTANYNEVFTADYYGDPVGGTGFQMDITGKAYVANTGEWHPHNNVQPYITCYIWKRTA